MPRDVLLFNVFWPLNRYQMRTLHQPSFQMAHLTLKSLERYCPNKRYLYDMVTNVKLIVLLNFELILIMLQFDRPETRHELYEKITDE